MGKVISMKRYLIFLLLLLFPLLNEAEESPPLEFTLEQQAQLASAKLYNVIVHKLYQEGKYKQALPYAEKVYRMRQAVLGEKHPDTLRILSNLAIIYQEADRLDKALPLHEKAYQLRQAVLGEKHLDTLISLSNLASIYRELGRLDKALPLTEKAYQLCQAVLGEKHPHTLVSLNNLGVIYKALARLDKALPLTEKAYQLRQTVLGEKHPDTLGSLNNLASIYHDMGRLDKALPLFEKAYRLHQEVLGEKHPDTLGSLNNLAPTYHDVGRLENALSLAEKTYLLYQEIFGEKHSNTLVSLNNLVSIYQALGQLNEALPLSEKSYRLRQEVSGEKHPSTLTSLNNLAVIYGKLGRLNEALPLTKKAYQLCQAVLGEKHPHTLFSLNNLASIYQALGRLDKALPLFEKIYRLHQEVLGEKHPRTLISLNNLASIYYEEGRLDKALPLFEKAYQLCQAVLGEKHPDTIISMNNLGHLYAAMGELPKALVQFARLVEGVEQLRAGNFSPENRQALFQEYTRGYFNYATYQLRANQQTNAFHTSELTKARTLLESMALKLAIQRTALTDQERQQLQDYHQQITALNHRIVQNAGLLQQMQKQIETLEAQATKTQDQQQELTILKNKHSVELEKRIYLHSQTNQLTQESIAFQQDLKARYPKFAQLVDPKILTVEQGKKLLPKDSLFISYLEYDNQVLVFTLDHTGDLQAHDLGKISPVELEKYYQLLETDAKNPNTPVPILLSKKLFHPIQTRLEQYPHWIISPSGGLAKIPFEALVLNGEPVVKNYQISYVQSLSAYALLKEREKELAQVKNRKTLLAMGAPFYHPPNNPPPQSKCNQTKGDPQTSTEKLVQADAETYQTALQNLNFQWCNLKFTEKELDALAALFAAENPIIYRHQDASEPKLLALNQQNVLSQYQYLHFSAHGYFDNTVPLLSSLVLDQLNTDAQHDGYITASEWIGYNLRSDLMVLSACQTALGDSVRGEGIMGLPYALYIAGNKNTLLTLWKIDDESTTEFLTRFYQKIKSSQSHIQALTETKREFFQHPVYRHPYFWAAFLLYGV